MTGEMRLAMLEHAWEVAPQEACGVVAGGQVIRIKNVSSDPESFFAMDEQELMAVYENYGGIEGVYHSHPKGNPRPSTTDLDHAPTHVPYYIVTMGDVHEYNLASH